MEDTQKTRHTQQSTARSRKPNKLTKNEMYDLNAHIFSCFAKNNFQVDYQQSRSDLKPRSQGKPNIDINRFENYFEYKLPNRSKVTSQMDDQQYSVSQMSRNTVRFDRKSSYFLQDQNQAQFMNQITKKQSFCFKSLPRSAMKIKEVEQTEKKLKQVHRREDYKYTISPLVIQEQNQIDKASKLYIYQNQQVERDLSKSIDYKKLRSMHDNNDVGDLKQRDIKEQLQQAQQLRDIRKQMNKQYKIIQNQFKSGIMNVDTPMNTRTKCYKEFNEKLTKQMQQQQNKQNQHRLLLSNRQGTHHYINISNFYNNSQMPVPIKKNDGEVVIQKKGKFNIDYKKYFLENTKHDGLKKIESINEKREKRKQNLVDQCLRGKSYDIVSNNIIELV